MGCRPPICDFWLTLSSALLLSFWLQKWVVRLGVTRGSGPSELPSVWVGPPDREGRALGRLLGVSFL